MSVLNGKTLSPQNDLRLLEDRFSFFKDCRDSEILRTDKHWIVGLDEVGRGCVAGPVTASAFAYQLTEESLLWTPPYRVIDSKRLSPKARFEAQTYIQSEPNFVAKVAECSPEEIDQINILQASLLAMAKAAKDCLINIPDSARIWVFVDGNQMPQLKEVFNGRNWDASCVVKGDSHSFAIAGASIMAKENRDSFMKRIAADVHEDFGWETNVGYPTPAHKSAVKEHGLTKWHRKTFRV